MQARDFLSQCFQVDPALRPSAEELLHHPFVDVSDESVRGVGYGLFRTASMTFESSSSNVNGSIGNALSYGGSGHGGGSAHGPGDLVRLGAALVEDESERKSMDGRSRPGSLSRFAWEAGTGLDPDAAATGTPRAQGGAAGTSSRRALVSQAQQSSKFHVQRVGEVLHLASAGDLEGLLAEFQDDPTVVRFCDYDQRSALHLAASEGHAHVSSMRRWGTKGFFLMGESFFWLFRLPADLTKPAPFSGRALSMRIFFLAPLGLLLDALTTRTSISSGGQVVRWLLENGADVNARDRWSRTPLDDALRGNFKVRRGCRVWELQICHAFLSCSFYGIVCAPQLVPSRQAVAEILQAAGATQKASSSSKRVRQVGEVLHMCGTGNLAGLRTQHERMKECIHFRDYDKRGALHLAASEGHLDVVKWLVENGCDVNVKDRWGNTPLQDAIRGKFAAVADFLIGAGAEQARGEWKLGGAAFAIAPPPILG